MDAGLVCTNERRENTRKKRRESEGRKKLKRCDTRGSCRSRPDTRQQSPLLHKTVSLIAPWTPERRKKEEEGKGKKRESRTLQAPLLDLINHRGHQHIRRPLVHIMAQLDGATGIQAIDVALDAGLDSGFGVVGPVEGVDVGLDDVVAELAHGLEDEVVGGEVGRAHVGRVFAEDVRERCFEELHLGDDARVVERCEVGVGPAGVC